MKLNLSEQVKNISSKEDLSNFIKYMEKDFKENSEKWENTTIASFLEAMSAWMDDMESLDNELEEKGQWNVLAQILYAARNYE